MNEKFELTHWFPWHYSGVHVIPSSSCSFGRLGLFCVSVSFWQTKVVSCCSVKQQSPCRLIRTRPRTPHFTAPPARPTELTECSYSWTLSSLKTKTKNTTNKSQNVLGGGPWDEFPCQNYKSVFFPHFQYGVSLKRRWWSLINKLIR